VSMERRLTSQRTSEKAPLNFRRELCRQRSSSENGRRDAWVVGGEVDDDAWPLRTKAGGERGVHECGRVSEG
jgi:hypothetical protein